MNSVLTCSCPFRGRASAEVFPLTPTVTRILPLGSGHYSRTALLVAGITFLVSSGGPGVCWAEYLHPVDLHLRKTIQLSMVASEVAMLWDIGALEHIPFWRRVLRMCVLYYIVAKTSMKDCTSL